MAMGTRLGKTRDPERERFWRRTIADQSQSDLAIKAYCRRHGLSPATFRFWQRELARRDAESPSTRAGERPATSTELARTPASLPVRVVQVGLFEPKGVRHKVTLYRLATNPSKSRTV
jgi:hypothetical protein